MQTRNYLYSETEKYGSIVSTSQYSAMQPSDGDKSVHIAHSPASTQP